MDLNREICSIAYNCLNLPQRVDFQDGSYVLYTYNAGGEKLRTDYYILDTRTLDTPDILEEMAFMEELYKTAVEKGIGNGTNITYMLQNADFSQSNFQGWETSRTNSGNFYSRNLCHQDRQREYQKSI